MPVTQALIAANIAVFLLEQVFGGAITRWFALWPLASGGFMPWQLLSYAFLHGSLLHLGLNLFGLWMFGGELERLWGPRRQALFITASVLCAALAQLAATAETGSALPTIGASGGLFGLLVGFAMVFPRRTVWLLLPPVPLPAWLFVTLYGAVELALGVSGSARGIAHFAHLGGLLGGWLVVRCWRRQPPFGHAHR